MKKSDKKQYVFDKLSELLKPKGYYLVKTGLDPRFVLKNDNEAIFFVFNFNNAGDITFSKELISVKIIEDIMIEIKIPTKHYTHIDNKKYFLITLQDKATNMLENYRKGSGYMVNSQSELVFFTNWLIEYLENEGNQFVKKYSFLPNILNEMDKLQEEGLNWNDPNKGILFGALDAYFRGLIISKLCNDVNFENKIEIMDKKFNQTGYENWIPAYEELKKRLETIEPIYNL